MMIQRAPIVPFGEPGGDPDIVARRHWRMRELLSRTADHGEYYLSASGFDRGPWLTVALAAGIGVWFLFDTPWQWIVAIAASLACAIAVFVAWQNAETRSELRLSIGAFAMTFALGVCVVWAHSTMVGTPSIAHPMVITMDARILDREEQPAQGRIRLVLATRNAETRLAMRVRINVPVEKDFKGLQEGARIALRARLMPPAPPLLPGAYDFARKAWFDGLSATGSLIGKIEIIEPANGKQGWIAKAQRKLSAHVRTQVDGSAGSIAAAFASGDRGGISDEDENAMRDAGLTHLLSISGLHVSAVIAGAYFLAMKLLTLNAWITLRVRIPLLAAMIAAGAGIGYTLLTGAQVPTVRSCIGAILVLGALALGREPLSLRMIAIAAGVVLLLWPISLVGPSFQMSFAAVIAIVALHNTRLVRDFLSPREESWVNWLGRRIIMLFVTGMVIEIALTPIVLYHFHRAGLLGAFSNVLAIPLVTFIAMPLIAIALFFDVFGVGAPFWWLAGQSLDILLWVAHFTASQPGAVKLVPHMGLGTLLLFVSGGLWLAFWRGRVRLFGLLPTCLGAVALVTTSIPDLLVTRDGRNVGITDEKGGLFILRGSPDSYSRTNVVELAGSDAEPLAILKYPGARCSADFCTLPIQRGKKSWAILIALNQQYIDERQLAAACELSDIVLADRWLPRSCKPRWLKIDRRFLQKNGGLTIHLAKEQIDTVASSQGEHGWYRGAE